MDGKLGESDRLVGHTDGEGVEGSRMGGVRSLVGVCSLELGIGR